MKRCIPFLIVAALSLGLGLFFGIALGARLGVRLALTKQSRNHIAMHKDLTASSTKLASVRDGLLFDVQGFQAEISEGSFISYLRPDYVLAAFRQTDAERQQYRSIETYLADHGVTPLP